jgi:hypothetical protein
LQPSLPGDPLSQPEAAPLPGLLPGEAPTQLPAAPQSLPGLDQPSTLPGGNDPRFSQPPRAEQIEPSPFDGLAPQPTAPRNNGFSQPSPSDLGGGEPTMPERRTTSVNCEAIRERLRNDHLNKLDLSTTPKFGQGARSTREEADRARQAFVANTEVRPWCDREGNVVVEGRMVDLRNEEVVLDIGGRQRTIPLRDLCDVDLAYVGRVWNLPSSCGVGYDAYAGRNFVPSAMQWKASGLCHKPLYFEEVQLERYGHELGPVLQPLVSSAHFFGNIAVLPYKMGIHPAHECQYALGYYRPGDCAPYMLPPVPISLRGAAAQAAVVVGGAAIIP